MLGSMNRTERLRMYEKSCNKKRQFFTERECRNTIKMISRSTGRDELEPYKCEFCGWWHLGHKLGFELDTIGGTNDTT